MSDKLTHLADVFSQASGRTIDRAEATGEGIAIHFQDGAVLTLKINDESGVIQGTRIDAPLAMRFRDRIALLRPYAKSLAALETGGRLPGPAQE